MKPPAALCYFGILFAALAASGASAGEAEEVATAPLEPLSPDDSFEQQTAARSLRGMTEKDIWQEEAGDFIWGLEGDDFRTVLTSPPTAAPDDSETAGGGVATEEDIWQEESGNFIWGAEGDDFRTAPTSPPTAAPDVCEKAGGGEKDAKTEEDMSVTQAPLGKCHQGFVTQCGQYDPRSCVIHSPRAKKYCKWCPTCKKCVDKCTGLKIATCTKEKHCVWIK